MKDQKTLIAELTATLEEWKGNEASEKLGGNIVKENFARGVQLGLNVALQLASELDAAMNDRQIIGDHAIGIARMVRRPVLIISESRLDDLEALLKIIPAPLVPIRDGVPQAELLNLACMSKTKLAEKATRTLNEIKAKAFKVVPPSKEESSPMGQGVSKPSEVRPDAFEEAEDHF